MNPSVPVVRIGDSGASAAIELHATCRATDESNKHEEVGVGGDDGHDRKLDERNNQ